MRLTGRQYGSVSAIALVMVVTAAIACNRRSLSGATANQGVTVNVVHPDTPSGSKVECFNSWKDGVEEKHWKREVLWGGEKRGRVVVVMENLNLEVDGRDYGPLKAGDTVTIDAMNAGKVTVNDQERHPLTKNSDDKPK